MSIDSIRKYKDAGITKRIAAYVLDAVMFIAIPLLFGKAVFSSDPAHFNLLFNFEKFVVTVAFFVYQVVCIWKNGQTAASRILKIKVMSLKGSRVTFFRALIRGFIMAWFVNPIYFDTTFRIGALIVFSIALLYIDPIVGKKRHGFDLLTGTCVTVSNP